MARKLLIKKYSEGVFGHKDSDIALPFYVSKFFVDIDSDMFQIKEGNGGSGARRFPYLFTDVTVQVGNGAIESFTNKQDLFARLIEIRYTGMMDYVPTGTGVQSITAGTNITITGTAENPIINATGGGSSTPPFYGTFKKIRKGFGNSNINIDEVGDLFEGGISEGVYANLASWNGGVLTDSANFTIISTIEF